METPAELFELFKFIEQNYDLSKFNYKGINFWPLIRNEVRLNLNLKRKVNYSWHVPQRTKTFNDRIKTPYRNLKRQNAKKKFINSIKPLTDSHQICIYPNSLFLDTIQNKKYCRYIDPYYEVLKKEFKSINYFGFLTKNEVAPETLNPVSYLDLKDFIDYNDLKRFLSDFDVSLSNDTLPLKNALKELNDILFAKFNIRPLYNELIKHCFYVLDFKEYFDELFKVSNVKFIFIEDYFIYIQMAMCASAKENNIKVIEIQHGILDCKYFPYHENNSNYSVLPNYIWCWSERDQDNILKHNKNFKYLIPFVGGNMWLRKFIKKEIQEITKQEESFFSELKSNYKTIILISLQPTFLLSENMIETVSNAPANCFFLIRYHPLNTTLEERNTIRTMLKGFTNVEIDIASTINLYALFQKCDFQLTHSSATAIEAIAFNLPTIICSEIGYDLYREQINDGVILYSKNSKQTIEILKSNPKLNYEKSNFYLLKTDEKEALVNLNKTISDIA